MPSASWTDVGGIARRRRDRVVRPIVIRPRAAGRPRPPVRVVRTGDLWSARTTRDDKTALVLQV